MYRLYWHSMSLGHRQHVQRTFLYELQRVLRGVPGLQLCCCRKFHILFHSLCSFLLFLGGAPLWVVDNVNMETWDDMITESLSRGRGGGETLDAHSKIENKTVQVRVKLGITTTTTPRMFNDVK